MSEQRALNLCNKIIETTSRVQVHDEYGMKHGDGPGLHAQLAASIKDEIAAQRKELAAALGRVKELEGYLLSLSCAYGVSLSAWENRSDMFDGWKTLDRWRKELDHVANGGEPHVAKWLDDPNGTFWDKLPVPDLPSGRHGESIPRTNPRRRNRHPDRDDARRSPSRLAGNEPMKYSKWNPFTWKAETLQKDLERAAGERRRDDERVERELTESPIPGPYVVVKTHRSYGPHGLMLAVRDQTPGQRIVGYMRPSDAVRFVAVFNAQMSNQPSLGGPPVGMAYFATYDGETACIERTAPNSGDVVAEGLTRIQANLILTELRGEQ